MKLQSKSAKIFAAVGIFASFLAFGCTRAAGGQNLSKNFPHIDMNSWNYNEKDDVYWQVGIQYVEKPADLTYHTLGLFVPGKFFDGTKNDDGTYSVSVRKNAAKGSFTAENAPFVMPIETPGYAAMKSPSGYADAVKNYTDEGMIFVYAGARGRDHGAPLGVTDFKAAIRFVRANALILPGDTARLFTYGMSGGGAQSALIGATGDAPEYEPYLSAIGAVMTESDAVMGSMDWCPITNLNVANEAYEWELGTARTNLSGENKALSDALSLKFAEYINALGLKDENGNALSLTQSEDGLYHAGSYYDYLKKTIETSLNNFLRTTKFPYNVEEQKNALGQEMLGELPMMMGRGKKPEMNGEPPKDGEPNGEQMPPEMKGEPPMGEKPNGNPPQGNFPSQAADFENRDNVQRNAASGTITISGTYATVEDYINALNAAGIWVYYDKATNTAKIKSVEDLMKALKVPSKNVGAFDDLNGTQGENTLFGYGDGKGAHWDATMAEALEKINAEKSAEYKADLAKKDALGTSIATRLDMYNPMFYLSPYYKGFKTAKPAQFWRIRTGIFQGDTAISTELDYTLALKSYGSEVKSVDFATIWGLYHVEAEESGTSQANFIAWVKECLE